ncbi:MAG: polysaccharide deacetylase family protein [Verrucomicrobiota bacterium]
MKSWSGGATVSRVTVSQPVVALTFDDGPHPVNTQRLLDILQKENAKATFYMVGPNIQSYPSLAQRAVNEGHEIGNHTWNHANLTRMTDQQVIEDIDKTDDVINKVTGIYPSTFRAPYGAMTRSQRLWVYERYKRPTIFWTIDPRDWAYPDIQQMTQHIISRASSGDIILLHDIHATTVDAVPGIIKGLKEKGLKFVTVSQLMSIAE